MTADDWSTADPSLTDSKAPYESAGILRAHRGMPGPALLKTFRMRGTKMMTALQKALAEENKAQQKGLEIHDERITEYE